MTIYYEDIVGYEHDHFFYIMDTLQNIARRNNEHLVIECKEKKDGWMPPQAILEMADKIIMTKENGKQLVIKDRFL